MSNNPVKREGLAHDAVIAAQKQVPGLTLKVASGVPHSRMPLLMAAADVVLLTSVHEGWPNVIKEGLACGRPFVSTDVGDLKEIAAVERTCRVVDASPKALSEALLEVLAEPKIESHRLRACVQEFSIARTTSRLQSIYRELADK
jgi:glycosyltransferase involved in cell wall biosynthesis